MDREQAQAAALLEAQRNAQRSAQHRRMSLCTRLMGVVWPVVVFALSIAVLYLVVERLAPAPVRFCASDGSAVLSGAGSGAGLSAGGAGLRASWEGTTEDGLCVPCPAHARCGVYMKGDLVCDVGYHRIGNSYVSCLFLSPYLFLSLVF